MKDETVVLPVRMKKLIKEAIKELADRKGMKVSAYVRTLIYAELNLRN